MPSLTLRRPDEKAWPYRPRMVAVDMDGTLLRSDHSLAPETVRAVTRARNLGIAVVLASSRPPVGMRPSLRALGLTGPNLFVGCQGGVVGSYDPDDRLRVHASAPIPREDAIAAWEVARAAGVVTNWYTDVEWYVDEITAEIEREAGILGLAPTLLDDPSNLAAPSKLLFITPSPSASATLTARFPRALSAVTSNPTYVEVTARGVDKASGVGFIIGELGIDPAEVVAIGDGHNDLTLFRRVGLSIAPANAHPEVTAAADATTSSNDDDGVAAALDALCDLPSRPAA